MRPILSYTVWFSQRTGSTTLCAALAGTGIAGKPGEWLYAPAAADLLEYFGARDHAELQQKLWELGSRDNGVCGLKFSFYEPYFSRLINVMRAFPGCATGSSRPAVWENAFPNSHHIFMTRRNKVRLAVSWWKAIKTQEWQRASGHPPAEVDLRDAYSFDAIKQLYCECSMREAGIQEFFAEAGIVPLTLVYEDFLQDYEGTVRGVLRFLSLDAQHVQIHPPYFERLADEISEEWVQRFRSELQEGWINKGW